MLTTSLAPIYIDTFFLLNEVLLTMKRRVMTVSTQNVKLCLTRFISSYTHAGCSIMLPLGGAFYKQGV